MQGTIFNIQRFCLQDGPGIRTTVFLKGCPLRCAWCHNPESHRVRPELMYDEKRCILCGACARVCAGHTFSQGGHHLNRENCLSCGKCAAVCAAGALEVSGRMATVEEVLSEVMRDAVFYAEDGGLTISGGEPLMQPEFTLALSRAAKEQGLHVCIETCGEGDRRYVEALCGVVDLFLFDVKLLDEEAHIRWTGVSNRRILENLRLLNERGARVILRCPLIEGVNCTREHVEGVCRLADELPGVEEIQWEPYHPLGLSKAVRLGREMGYTGEQTLPRDQAEALIRGLTCRVPLTVQ